MLQSVWAAELATGRLSRPGVECAQHARGRIPDGLAGFRGLDQVQLLSECSGLPYFSVMANTSA